MLTNSHNTILDTIDKELSRPTSLIWKIHQLTFLGTTCICFTFEMETENIMTLVIKHLQILTLEKKWKNQTELKFRCSGSVFKPRLKPVNIYAGLRQRACRNSVFLCFDV